MPLPGFHHRLIVIFIPIVIKVIVIPIFIKVIVIPIVIIKVIVIIIPIGIIIPIVIRVIRTFYSIFFQVVKDRVGDGT